MKKYEIERSKIPKFPRGKPVSTAEKLNAQWRLRSRVAFTPLMNSTSQTAPLSLEAGADCDFSFYRAARPVIGLKGKGDYGFLNIPGEIITRIRNPTTRNRERVAQTNNAIDVRFRTISTVWRGVQFNASVKENEIKI